jgi:hypothetical protein
MVQKDRRAPQEDLSEERLPPTAGIVSKTVYRVPIKVTRLEPLPGDDEPAPASRLKKYLFPSDMQGANMEVYLASDADAALAAERERADRASYGTPCRCESWIEACRKAEDECDSLTRQLTEARKAYDELREWAWDSIDLSGNAEWDHMTDRHDALFARLDGKEGT